MSNDIFLISTPLRQVGELAYGGPLRLRVGKSAAYAGFRNAALAHYVAEFWGIAGEHSVDPWHEALANEMQGPRVRRIVVFESRAHFARYLRDRERFDFTAHTVVVHPALVGRQDCAHAPPTGARPLRG